MNDFTREELQHIYDGLWMLSKLGWEKSDLTKCKKIASMIENYCEHKKIGIYIEAGYVYFCRDCSAVTGEI